MSVIGTEQALSGVLLFRMKVGVEVGVKGSGSGLIIYELPPGPEAVLAAKYSA